jgi:hypothetical protein
MDTLKVLLIIDAAAAAKRRTLTNNSYVVDTKGAAGSWRLGAPVPHTTCQDGQMIVWSVAALSPAGNVAIAHFGGEAVAKGVCKPVAGLESWSGQVESRGKTGSYSYSVTVTVEGRPMTLNSFLQVV